LPNEVNRFNALVGFYVDADKNMVVEGVKLIAEVNAQLSASAEKNTEPQKLNTYWDKQPLSASENLSRDTSVAFGVDPAQWLLAKHDIYSASVSSNQILLERFRQLITMQQYSYTMKLDIKAPFISYSSFLAIKRLNNLSIIDEFINDNKQDAIYKLQQSIGFSKLMMKQSAFLLDKMIAAALLKIDLLTYSSLLDQSPDDDNLRFVMTNLQADESDMLNVFKGEFAFLSTSLDIENALNKGDSSAAPGLLEVFMMRSFLKPKMMENNAYKNMWLPFLELKDQSLAAREAIMEGLEENKLSWWKIYLDPIGYVLFSIATPSYFGYIDSIDHADATITLLNLKASIYANKISSGGVERYITSINAVMNPGYKGAKFSWNKDKRELSFDIPDYRDEGIPRIKLYTNRKR
ncbi:MAG: hypothetical protein KAT90_05070, partial [Gammaproteobacteria bacterium]|nr:hypothetical protein [Gammaproteobacteria bacterium]